MVDAEDINDPALTFELVDVIIDDDVDVIDAGITNACS